MKLHNSTYPKGTRCGKWRKAIFPQQGNFTLVELLVVVSIIGILAAVALPNFLSAQCRAKVSKTRAGLRVLKDGAEAYRVDWNRYPPTVQLLPEDPYGILADVQLRVLTTPVSYVSNQAFRDPFGKIKGHAIRRISGADRRSRTNFPIPDAPNPNAAFLYYNYYYFSRCTNNPLIDVTAIALISIGPDRKDSFGAFGPFAAEALPPLAEKTGIKSPADTVYDPTNGTVSGGDISGFAGEIYLPYR